MGKKVVDDESLKSVANHIRAKTGKTGNIIFPSGFETEIDGITTGTDTSDATINPNSVLKGKIGYGKDGKVVGKVGSEKHSVTPTKSNQTIRPNKYPNLISEVLVNKIPDNYIAASETVGNRTITPGTSNKLIRAGTFCAGDQTIEGSPNLVPGNIKSGVSVFGVTGNYAGEKNPDLSSNIFIESTEDVVIREDKSVAWFTFREYDNSRTIISLDIRIIENNDVHAVTPKSLLSLFAVGAKIVDPQSNSQYITRREEYCYFDNLVDKTWHMGSGGIRITSSDMYKNDIVVGIDGLAGGGGLVFDTYYNYLMRVVYY